MMTQEEIQKVIYKRIPRAVKYCDVVICETDMEDRSVTIEDWVEMNLN